MMAVLFAGRTVLGISDPVSRGRMPGDGNGFDGRLWTSKMGCRRMDIQDQDCWKFNKAWEVAWNDQCINDLCAVFAMFSSKGFVNSRAELLRLKNAGCANVSLSAGRLFPSSSAPDSDRTEGVVIDIFRFGWSCC